MKNWLLNLSLSTKTGIMALLGYSFFGFVVILVVISTLTSELTGLAREKVELSSAIARETIKQHGQNFNVKDSQIFIGDHLLNGDNEIVDRIAGMTNGLVTIFMGDTRVATNVPNAQGGRAVGSRLAAGPIHDAVYLKKQTYHGETTVFDKVYLGIYEPILDKSGIVIGALFVGIPKDAELSAVQHLLSHIIEACAVTSLIMSIVTFIVLWWEARPLGKLEHAMVEIVNENTNVDVPKLFWNDEIGRMAIAVEKMKKSVADKIRMREELLAREKNAEKDRQRALSEMADDFELQVMSIVELVGTVANDVQSNAESVSANAETSSTKAVDVSTAIKTVSGDVQMVATSAQQLSGAIDEINRQIGSSVEVASRCVAEAERTSETMRSLDAAADNVGNVVKLIEEIAGRVNLLALNATIESARAGEAGKGFAVVANEVKNLANQVATAAKDITSQISGIQDQTTEAVNTIEDITKTIRQMNDISNNIADAVHSQGEATYHITENIQKTANATSEVNNNITQVTQASAKTGEASTILLGAANRLTQESSTLQRSIEKFITHFRTGS